jgi:hypothetical protein
MKINTNKAVLFEIRIWRISVYYRDAFPFFLHMQLVTYQVTAVT